MEREGKPHLLRIFVEHQQWKEELGVDLFHVLPTTHHYHRPLEQYNYCLDYHVKKIANDPQMN